MNAQENSLSKTQDFSEADNFYKTIGEVSAELSIPPHVLRFWESKFLNIKPHKRKGGHRYYSKMDVEAVYEIKKLLYEEGYTIKGAQKHLREKGYMQQVTEDQQSLFVEEKVFTKPSVNPEPHDLLSLMDNNPVKSVDTDAVKLLLEELESIKKILKE